MNEKTQRNNTAMPGHFYAVGIGPGSADLLTFRAARIIETADIIIAPRSSIADSSLALNTIKHLITSKHEVIDHKYNMRKNTSATITNWKPIADIVAERCKEGKAVAQITIGDPMLYSTSAYLLPLVLERLPEDYVHIVPGISAFQAAASIFLQPLTIQNDRFMLMPATDLNDVERALAQCETLVLYKCANVIDQLVKLLKKHGLINRAKMVCYAEQPDRQVVYRSIADLSKDNFGYMATVLIYIGRRPWNHEKD